MKTYTAEHRDGSGARLVFEAANMTAAIRRAVAWTRNWSAMDGGGETVPITVYDGEDEDKADEVRHLSVEC